MQEEPRDRSKFIYLSVRSGELLFEKTKMQFLLSCHVSVLRSCFSVDASHTQQSYRGNSWVVVRDATDEFDISILRNRNGVQRIIQSSLLINMSAGQMPLTFVKTPKEPVNTFP